MKTILHLLGLAVIAWALPVQADSDSEKAGFAAIKALGQLNGVALQCGYRNEVKRMKRAVVEFVPKTRVHGAAFEEATNAGFLDHIKAKEPCPTAATLEASVDEAIAKVREAYPPQQP